MSFRIYFVFLWCNSLGIPFFGGEHFQFLSPWNIVSLELGILNYRLLKFHSSLFCFCCWEFVNKNVVSFKVIQFFKILFHFILLFMATPTAYRDSQARGRIGATAAGLRYSHSNLGSEPHLWPTPQLTATPDP